MRVRLRSKAMQRASVWVLILLAASLWAGCGDDASDAGALDQANNGAINNGDSNNGDTNNGGSSNNGDGWANNGDSNNGWGEADMGEPAPEDQNNGVDPDEPGGNTNISLSGEQDFGYFRRLLENNIVPRPEQMQPDGFFAEHHTALPQPVCGERICLQGMLGVMGNLINGNNCTMLQVGLNSPLTPDLENRPELNLAVVVDVSGSMQQAGKINFVRDGLHKMVDELRDGDRMSIITYETEVNVPFAMQEIAEHREELHLIINQLQAGGSTNLYDGLESGYQQIFAHYDSGRQNRVILLSDGEPTAGETSTTAITAMSRGYNSDGIGLTTVGLGTDFNVGLMRGLAQQADGNFYFVENAAAVDEVFTEELSYFTLPVAFDLELEVLSGQDYTFARAMGAQAWQDTENGGRMEIPSVFLAHRTAHDDVTEEGGRRGGGSALLIELMPREDDGTAPSEADVASLSLRFREPGTNRIVTETLEVSYPHAPWEVLSSGFFENAIVTKSFVMLNIYVALENACASFHEGDSENSIIILERLIAAARDYEDSANGGEGDVDIQYDIALMEELIQVILNNGGQHPGEIDIDEDPWPDD